MAGTSNEGLNTMANIGITTTARSVDRRKKQMSDAHTKYAEDALQPYEQTALILNVDDYHNIHTQRKPIRLYYVISNYAINLIIYVMAKFWHAGMVIVIIAWNNVKINVLYVWNIFRKRSKRMSMR